MVSTPIRAALAAASLLSLLSTTSAQLIPTPSTTMPMNALSTPECYSTAVPMVDHGPYLYQSNGNCQGICYELQMPVMGLVNGTNCWCGSELPPADTKVDYSNCNTPCAGYGQDMCGGANFWSVYLTGITKNQIGHYEPNPASSSAAAQQPATTNQAAAIAPSIVTVGGSTVVMTVPAGATPTTPQTPASSNSNSKGPSKAGIAAGVVVGVVAIAAIVGGVFLILRHRRRKAMEEEHRRMAAASDFVAGGKRTIRTSHSSMNDSRLDPEVVMQRRQSDGSIADNQDYSRRILKVTNPSPL